MRRRTVLALAGAALVAAGCGGGGAAAPGQHRLGGSGATDGRRLELRLADCRDWNGADPYLRNGILKGLRAFAGSPVGNGTPLRGATLPDGRAGRVLDDWCSHSYARAFKLYKLYERSAAFTDH